MECSVTFKCFRETLRSVLSLYIYIYIYYFNFFFGGGGGGGGVERAGYLAI